MKKLYLLFVLSLFTVGSLFSQALTGIKTINPVGGDYTTFAAAVADLNSKGVGLGGLHLMCLPVLPLMKRQY